MYDESEIDTWEYVPLDGKSDWPRVEALLSFCFCPCEVFSVQAPNGSPLSRDLHGAGSDALIFGHRSEPRAARALS